MFLSVLSSKRLYSPVTYVREKKKNNQKENLIERILRVHHNNLLS